MAVIVVYGGGFQPFHAGHLSSYIEAKQAFPEADFYVAASNDTKTRPIPFDDKKFLAQQAGVADPFVQVVAPINPKEILDRYNPNKDIFILVRSERDPVGYTKKDGSPGYYQPFTSLDKCEPFGYHGYVFVTHKKEFKLNGQDVYSGTQVRDMYANSDDRGRQIIVKQLYPQSKQQNLVKQMLDKYIGTMQDPIEKPVTGAIKKLKANKLKEQILRIRPLIKEASLEQKYKFLKLMKEAAQLNELNLFKKKKPVAEPVQEPETSPNDYHSYFNQPKKPEQKVYSHPGEYFDKTKIDPLKVKQPVKEFAVGDSGDDNGDEEYDILFKLAKQWWLGTEQDMIKAERTLASMGWEIGEDEGYDEGGVFVVRAGDVNGKSYISWSHNDLSLNEISDKTLQNYLGRADKQVSNRLSRMGQARDRLNKNYEIYDVNNPTKIINKFEANTPKLAREYLYKFIDSYNPGDKDFHFEVRRSTGLSGQGVAESQLNEFVPPEGSDSNNDRNRRLRKLLEIAINVAEENNVGTLGMVHAMNIIAGDDFFRVAVEGILPDITDREYTFIIQSAYKTVKQGNVDEGQVVPFKQKNPLTPNLIKQLKALSQQALELFWEGSYMPTAAQGQIAQLSQEEQNRMFKQNEANFKSLGYEYSMNEEESDILYLHSIAREQWYEADKPANQYRGLPDLMYNQETNTLSYYDLIGDDGYEYTDNTQFEDVNEARLHFTDPNAKINVYYITPKLHREGKVQNIAHNIPYKLLEPFTNALIKKYKNLIPDYIVWHHVSDDPNAKYGERIEESMDYLEEK